MVNNTRDNARLSKSELETLRHLGEFKSEEDLAKLLKKSYAQIYRILRSLREKKILFLTELVNVPYLKQLVLLVKKYPNLINVLKDSGITILLELLSAKTIKEISKQTLLDEQTVYKVVQKAKQISLVSREGKKYVINGKAWPEAKEFLEELNKQEMSFDSRVPSDSIIYHKSKKEIIFSNQRKLDAELTAFSAFEKFGVRVFPVTNYYYLPGDNLSKEDIFKHALLITNKEQEISKEPSIRNIVFLAIFMLKNNMRSNDLLAKKIKQVLLGHKVEGFPPREELKEKALVYGVVLE